jgi:hypothetical protein
MAISSMESDLTFDERPDYLYARIAAKDLDRKTALDYLSEISLKCARTRCKRMLLEREMSEIMADEHLFASIKDLVEMSGGIRIAFVNRHVPTEEARKRLSKWKAGADFKYFNDAEEAHRWLLGH